MLIWDYSHKAYNVIFHEIQPLHLTDPKYEVVNQSGAPLAGKLTQGECENATKKGPVTAASSTQDPLAVRQQCELLSEVFFSTCDKCVKCILHVINKSVWFFFNMRVILWLVILLYWPFFFFLVYIMLTQPISLNKFGFKHINIIQACW